MRGADDGDGAVGGGADAGAGARHARFGAAGALCWRRDHAWTTKTKKKKKKKRRKKKKKKRKRRRKKIHPSTDPGDQRLDARSPRDPRIDSRRFHTDPNRSEYRTSRQREQLACRVTPAPPDDDADRHDGSDVDSGFDVGRRTALCRACCQDRSTAGCARSRGTENGGTYWSAATRSPGSSPVAGRTGTGPNPCPTGLRRWKRAGSL